MRTEPLVRARGVRKTYRSGSLEVTALRGVDLDVAGGESVAVVGPSGCGKTTLLNCLSGLDDVDRGEILVDGEAIHRLSDRRRTALRARRMGFVFQSLNLLPVLSAVENVELPLLVNGLRAPAARRRAQTALVEVGLADRADHRPAELSGGQQQRVAIARALVTEPAIVWADEPTGNLDSETSAGVIDLIERLNRERGASFVIVTHDAAVSGAAHRVIQMQDGYILPDDPVGTAVPARPRGRGGTG